MPTRYREFQVLKERKPHNDTDEEQAKGLSIEEVFKFPSGLKELIPAELKSRSQPLADQEFCAAANMSKRRQDDYWRMPEAKDLLWRYVNEQKLVPENNKRAVRMDEYLAINVMGKKTFFGDAIDRKTLSEKYFRIPYSKRFYLIVNLAGFLKR